MMDVLILIDFYRVRLTACDARPLLKNDRIIRTRLRAFAAFDAFTLIDDTMLVHDSYCVFGTHFRATVRNTSATSGRDENSVDRTFVARDVDDLDYVVVVLVAAHCEFQTLLQNRAFFIYATAQAGFRTGHYLDRDVVKNLVVQAFVICLYELFYNLVFKLLYRSIE